MYTVYKHVTPCGKVYIGITGIDPKARWNSGGGYKNNEHFDRAIKKYGWANIRHEIIATGLEKAEACAMEIQLIKEYDSTNPKKGYNKSHGGDGGNAGVPLSEEAKRKIGIAHKGMRHTAEARLKMSVSRKGIKPSEEARKKMSAARKGHITSEETRRKIGDANRGNIVSEEQKKIIRDTHRRCCKCVETGIVYDAIIDAKRATGIDNIDRACSGERKTAGGFHWVYVE